jgi:hypothetical protein
MDGEGQHGRLRTFVLGGLVGASAVLAAARRRRPGREARPVRAGLAAFEDAPCHAELLEHERVESQERGA